MNLKDLVRLSILVLFATCLAIATSRDASAEPYQLDTGDVLQIQLLEKKDVSGTYTVGIDGAISLPGFGVVSARGGSIRRLEEKLRALVAQTIVDPSVSVQVVQYRPFFIVGDVFEAGKYPYMANLTVLQAVSLAKGFRRKVEAGDKFSQQLANLRARQAIENGIVSLASARIQLARTLAEQQEADSFEFNPGDTRVARLGGLKEMIADEQELMFKRKEAFEKRLKQEQSTLGAREREAASYDERIESQKELLKQVAAERSSIARLKRRGLVSNERLNTLIREEIRVRGEVLQSRSLLRQSEVSVNETKQALLTLTLGRKVEIAQAIRNLNDTIKSLEAQLTGELAIFDTTDDGQLRSVDPQNVGYRFELYRDGRLVEDEVRLDTAIRPDDTLVVLRKEPKIGDIQLIEATKNDG